MLVFDHPSSAIYSDDFPKYGDSQFIMCTSETLKILMYNFKINPNAHPPILENIDGGTLLHHAVMTNNIEKVGWLIDMGARLDLKATYQIKPSESDVRYEYTPVELAKFLKLNAIVDLFQKHTEQAIPVDSKSFEQEKMLRAEPQGEEVKIHLPKERTDNEKTHEDAAVLTPTITRGELNNILSGYKASNFFGKKTKEVKNLLTLASGNPSDPITTKDIESILKFSSHRYNLFRGTEEKDETNTDAVVYQLREMFKKNKMLNLTITAFLAKHNTSQYYHGQE